MKSLLREVPTGDFVYLDGHNYKILNLSYGFSTKYTRIFIEDDYIPLINIKSWTMRAVHGDKVVEHESDASSTPTLTKDDNLIQLVTSAADVRFVEAIEVRTEVEEIQEAIEALVKGTPKDELCLRKVVWHGDILAATQAFLSNKGFYVDRIYGNVETGVFYPPYRREVVKTEISW